MKLPKNLPSPVGLSREEILEILYREEYGYPPPPPASVTAEVVRKVPYYFERKGELIHLDVTVAGDFGSFTFPVCYAKLKQATEPVPAFLYLSFSKDVPHKYLPCEEILDGGFNVLSVYYNDITFDDPHFSEGNFKDGIAGCFFPDGKRSLHDAGKLALWAWTASALLTYMRTLPELDPDAITVVGHSRLGKTALLAGAMDTRFFCAVSNDSGACGAALSREKTGETIKVTCGYNPYWFCKKFPEYFDNEDKLPFDQHYLIAANAPHRVYVGAGSEDATAAPMHEFLGAYAASAYFESVGKTGLICPDRFPEKGEFFHEGHVGYHLRDGGHYLSRYDWNMYMNYVKKHWQKQ